MNTVRHMNSIGYGNLEFQVGEYHKTRKEGNAIGNVGGIGKGLPCG